MTFAVVHDYVTLHSFMTLPNFRERFTVYFVIDHYLSDCFLLFMKVHACERHGGEGGCGHVEEGRCGHVLA